LAIGLYNYNVSLHELPSENKVIISIVIISIVIISISISIIIGGGGGGGSSGSSGSIISLIVQWFKDHISCIVNTNSVKG